MQRIRNNHHLDCLQKIEKAIGNAEKTFQSQIYASGNGLEGKSALRKAKQELEKAWFFHLNQHSERFYG